MSRYLTIITLLTALLASSAPGSIRNPAAMLRCQLAYAVIHADGHVTDKEASWLSSFDCWDDGTPVGVYGP